MRVLDLVLPERCAICERPGRVLCLRCRGDLTRLVPPVCERCGSPGPWPVRRCAECSGRRLGFAEARAAVVYDAGARALVRAWKETGRRRIAEESASLVAELLPMPEAECLVPVPGDPERAWRRGDVPSRSLAVALGGHWGLPARDVLERVRSLPRQRGLSLDARRTTSAAAWPLVSSCRRPSAWWTTCTRPERRSTRARPPAGAPERGGSRS